MPAPFRGEPAPPNADTRGVAAWVTQQLANIASVFATPVVKDHGTQSANYTFDPNIADAHLLTLGASITVTLVTVAIPDRTVVRWYVKQDGTGSRVPTISGVTWVSGITPTFQTAAGSLDIIELTFRHTAGGTKTWLGRQNAKNIKFYQIYYPTFTLMKLIN